MLLSFREFMETVALFEAAVRDLGEHEYLVLRERPGNIMYQLVYLDPQNLSYETCKVLANIRCYNSTKCKSAQMWHVTSVASMDKPGFGPTMYDLAMENITQKGGWMCRDMASTTNAASGIWGFYYNNRPDVQKQPIPMDCSKGGTVKNDGMNYMYRKPNMEYNTKFAQKIIKSEWSGGDALEIVAIKLGLMPAAA